MKVGDAVTLDGSGSSDPDTGDSLDYGWVQTAGPAVTLTGATTASPTFNAPSSEMLTFELTVTDENNLTDTDTVVVTVNDRPVADAGADKTVKKKTNSTLTGTGNDADGDPLTYAWTQVSGLPAVIRDPDKAETIVEGVPHRDHPGLPPHRHRLHRCHPHRRRDRDGEAEVGEASLLAFGA